ncbi:MAG: hypothetical protein AB1486_01575 [Planctomycetota bacterium]
MGRSLAELAELSLEERAAAVQREAAKDVLRAVEEARQGGLAEAAVPPHRLAWVLAWNIAPTDPTNAGGSCGNPGREAKSRPRTYSDVAGLGPQTSLDELCHKLTLPLQCVFR